MGIVSQRLRNSAKGQACTLRLPCCNHDPETTVLAHLPSHVSGMATKGDDFHAVFACSACHAAMDEHRMLNAITGYQLEALQRTILYWVINGDLIIASDKGDKPKPKSSKQLPVRRSIYGRG